MSIEREPYDPQRARTKQPLPLWMDAFLRDTMLLQADEFGVYIRLIAAMWARVDLHLPDDDRRLATCGGVSLRLWKQRIGPVIRPLLQVQDGIVWSRKLREVALSTERYLASRSSNRSDDDAKSARHAKPTGINKQDKKSDQKTDNTLKYNDVDQSYDETYDRSHDQSSVTSSNIPIKKEEEGARARTRDLGFSEGAEDALLRAVIEAVGLSDGDLPRFWIGDQAAWHVRRWTVVHGLSPSEIIAEAKKSRTKNANPPDGPKALDRWMEQAAVAKASASSVRGSHLPKPATPPVSPADRLQFYADLLNDPKKFVAPTTISNTLRDALLTSGLVTPETMKAREIR